MGVKVYHNGDWVEFSTGSNASASFTVEEEGTPLVGLATALNFVGSGVTASNTTGNPSTKKIEITSISTFLQLSDTPSTYVGTAGSVVTVNSTANGLEFLPSDSSTLGKDNYVDSASFSYPSAQGAQLTLGYAGPDNLSDITATLGIGLTQLSDTPDTFVGYGNSFVRVKSDQTGLEFLAQVPSTAVGAAGNDKQVQFNDNGFLAGADTLEFIKDSDSPDLILKPASTQASGIYGGNIMVQSTIDTGTSPWNSASITADGGLELNRRRISSPRGGPYVDFKSQIGVDFDARIQMDYDNGNVDDGAINPNGDDYSAITFQTGGNGYYSASNPSNTQGRVIERLRIGKAGEIGIQAGPYIGNGDVANNRTDAQKYGTTGQVLTSGGKGNSVYWGNSTTSSTFSSSLLIDITNPSPSPAANQGATVNLAEFRSAAPNSVELLIYNVRNNANVPNNNWQGVATRIGRQIDVTNHAHIQFGANDGSGEQNIHLHTNQLGDIQLQDAKRILLHANKVDFAKLGTITEGGYVGTDYAGMTIVANSGNVYGTTTIDTGISVNQGHGGGVGLLLSSDHNDWGTSAVDARVDMIKFAVGSGPSNRNSVPTRTNLGGDAVFIYIGKSTQNTLTITMNLPSGNGGRWALMMMGGNCVDAFTVDV